MACTYVRTHVDSVYMHIRIILASMIVGEIYTIISPVCNKWKDIGLELGLRPIALEVYGTASDPSSGLQLVLTQWLQRKDGACTKGGATWSRLIEALKSVGAGENILAACRVKAMTPNQTSK